jgi:hypothetical protein
MRLRKDIMTVVVVLGALVCFNSEALAGGIAPGSASCVVDKVNSKSPGVKTITGTVGAATHGVGAGATVEVVLRLTTTGAVEQFFRTRIPADLLTVERTICAILDAQPLTKNGLTIHQAFDVNPVFSPKLVCPIVINPDTGQEEHDCSQAITRFEWDLIPESSSIGAAIGDVVFVMAPGP